jgi:hypothetical protein
VQAREEARAVRVVMGLRQSWRRWSIGRKIICKEDRSERDARLVKRRRRWSILSFSLNCLDYLERFEADVGVDEQEYLQEVAPDKLRRMRQEEDSETYAGQLEYVQELKEAKLAFIASIGVHAMMKQLSPIENPTSLDVDAFLTRFSTENPTAERARLNWTQLARDTEGPTRIGDRSKIAPNAGQGWEQLMRASQCGLNMDLLCAQEGDRGYHRCRSANYRIQIGKKKYSMVQKPTSARIKDLFQETWVETGMVTLGVPIKAYDRKLVPDGEGGFKSVLHDTSGRHLTLTEHFLPHLQRARDKGYLRSMPPYLEEERMPLEVVEKRLLALDQPVDVEGESAMEQRLRARIAELAHRSDLVCFRPLPATERCTHCADTRFCHTCGAPAAVGCGCGVACSWGCIRCFRAKRRGKQEVLDLLHLRDESINVEGLRDASGEELDEYTELLKQV